MACGYQWSPRIENPVECPNCKSRRWSITSQKQQHASAAVSKALRERVLVKKPCEVCGDTKRIEAHHADYDNPLEVVWLCRTHHRQEHVRIGSGKNHVGLARKSKRDVAATESTATQLSDFRVQPSTTPGSEEDRKTHNPKKDKMTAEQFFALPYSEQAKARREGKY